MSAELLEADAPDVARAADGVRWLIDNADAYDALLDAIDGARRSVWITQLAFDADCVAYDALDAAAPGRRLIDAVVQASTGRDVDVRVLLNASLLLDTAAPLRAHLAGVGATRVQVRGIGRFPQLLHAKIVIVDGARAFLVGSPFANGYWDDARHRPVDARRPERELGGRPLHDLSCALTGPAVAALEALFVELWNDVSVGPAPHERLRAAADVRGSHDDTAAIDVVRTAPRRVLPASPDGVATILPALLDGIAGARSLIYVEHQYLSARPVVRALAAALAREPRLELIVVLNQNPDVTAYRGWQNAQLRESGLLDHPRVGLFALWTAARAATDTAWDVNQLFVHSKVLVVDDAWATVGSANLDGVSLHSYGDDFSGWPGRRTFRHVRNFDVNVVLRDGDGALGGAVAGLRRHLWVEHLGLPDESLAERPDGGWLALWRARAACNVAALGDGATPWAGFVLPYATSATPAAQLAEVGVPASDRVHLRFDPSWLEVHCSPNWFRNMFA